MNSIELANHNQTTVCCKYCPSDVKRSKMSSQQSRCHKDELLKERAREREVEVQFPHTSSLVPERPICHIVPNQDTENWDDSNYAPYNPLLATAHKPVIRGNYYKGFSKEDKRNCQKFEVARMAQIKETSPRYIITSYEPDVPVFLPEIYNDCDSSKESWSEPTISDHSTPSKLTEDSFKTCNSEGSNTSTHKDLSSFESSMAEYLRNLSNEKRAEVMQKFSKIMRDQ